MTVSGSHISFDSLAEQYIYERTLATATASRLRALLRLFQRDNGVQFIHEIQRDMLLLWRDRVIARASATTWNTYLRHLRALGNFAVENRWIASNPFRVVRQVPCLQHRRKTISTDTMRDTLRVLDVYPTALPPAWFWRAVIRTLAYTGMRRRQLISLRWADIDTERHTILLRAEGSKTRREWEIPMHLELREDLLRLRAETARVRSDHHLASAQIFNVCLFNPRYAGAEMTDEQVTRALRRLQRHVGENVRLSPHRFRHSLATTLSRLGDIKTLQNLLGHQDVRTTLGYIETSLDDMRALVARLPML